MNKLFTLKVPPVVQLSNITDLTEIFLPVNEACKKNQDFDIVIDMGELSFITPIGITALRAYIMYLSQHINKKSGHIIRPCQNVDKYLDRMDFYTFLKNFKAYNTRRLDSSGRFLEAIEVKTEKIGLTVTNQVVELLKKQLKLSNEFISSVQYTVSEIIDNVFHHANSPINGIVCAQAYPNLRRVEISIVDCGDGFYKSLQANDQLARKFSTPLEAIKLAIERKVTGRPSINAGEGLFFATELIKANKGNMVIYSEDGLLYIDDGDEHFKTVPYWKGSIVSLNFNLDNFLDIVSIFNNYAPPEEDYQFLFES